MEEIINGCLGLWVKETDFRLTEWIADALPPLYQQDEIIFQYNQGKQPRSKKSCTLFSPVGAISDLVNLQIWLDYIKDWDSSSYNEWRRPDEWWYVALWVDHIRKCYNNSDLSKAHWKVASYVIDLKDNELVKKVLDKRYTICTGYQWNAKYNNDKNDNWILEWTEFGTPTYWHAVNAIWWITTPSRIKDNYFETNRYNIYGVRHNFSEIPCFYDKWYIFTKVEEDALEDIKRLNEMNTVVLILIENNSKMWHLTNDEKFRNELHKQNNLLRGKQKDIENELKKYL